MFMWPANVNLQITFTFVSGLPQTLIMYPSHYASISSYYRANDGLLSGDSLPIVLPHYLAESLYTCKKTYLALL